VTDVRPAGVPSDTTIDAWRVEMNAVKNLTPSERFELWSQFQRSVDEIAVASIRRKYPDAGERFWLAELVRRSHGIELAQAAYPDIELAD